MKTLSSHAGYLEIDHRDSPGLSIEDALRVPGTLAVPGGMRLERDVKQCSHCSRMVVLQPRRVRARAWCPKCDHYICDSCEAIRVKSGACVPMVQQLDQAAALLDRVITAGDPVPADPLAAVSTKE